MHSTSNNNNNILQAASSSYASHGQRAESNMTSRATSPINLPSLDDKPHILTQDMQQESPRRNASPQPNFKSLSRQGLRPERVKFSALLPNAFKSRSKSPTLAGSSKLRISSRLAMKNSASQILPTHKEMVGKTAALTLPQRGKRSKSREGSPGRGAKKSSRKVGGTTSRPHKSLGPSKSQNSFLQENPY